MKQDTHPTYYPNAKIKCACGNVTEIGSTSPELKTEICSNCHPFYTGKEKLIDTAGRLERFAARKAKARDGVRKKSEKKAAKKAKRAK